MKQDIGGYKVDLLTGEEMRGHLTDLYDTHMRDQYRAVSYLMFQQSGNGTNTVAFAGPESGYAWGVKLIACQLSAVTTVSVYLGENANVPPVGTEVATAGVGSPGEAVIKWTSNVLIMTDNRTLTVACPDGTTILNARLHVKQVTAERVATL